MCSSCSAVCSLGWNTSAITFDVDQGAFEIQHATDQVDTQFFKVWFFVWNSLKNEPKVKTSP